MNHMMQVAYPALAIVLGLFLFFKMEKHPNVKELGRMLLFIGLFWTLFVLLKTPAKIL